MSSALARHRSRRWLYAGLLALGFSVVSSPSGAETSAFETVHLRYAAASSCPSEAEFVTALRRDTDPFEIVTESEARRLVEVDLRIVGRSARGRFRYVDLSHDTTVERELQGPDCEAVARAIAMMLALAMQRRSEPAPPPPPEDPSAPPSPLEEAPTTTLPIASSPREVERTGRSPATPPPRRRRPLHLALDLQAALTDVVVGEALPFSAMTLQLEPSRWRFRPALAVGVRQSLPGEVGVAGGGAKFLWTSFALRVCPHIVRVRTFDVAPCVEAALGRLGATADGLPAARSSASLWADGALLVAARWHFVPGWFLVAHGGVMVAFERTRFELSSGALISETPASGFRAGLGLGWEM